MLTRLSVVVLALAWAACAQAQAPVPTTPEGWRAAAAEDLAAIHDILHDNSPAMVVPRDSGHFRRWLESGLARARTGLQKVTDFPGYYYVIQGYVSGFHDDHIQFAPAGGRNFNLNTRS